MNSIDLTLSHIARGTTYSWDLTTLISLGIPVSCQLRQKLLTCTTTKQDADQIRALLAKPAHARNPL